ncbi:MAG: hypothetical protein H6550_07830 [Chitinophagales bacterium]|nr:hypothetical protein [Chitinophagales bacterium]
MKVIRPDDLIDTDDLWNICASGTFAPVEHLRQWISPQQHHTDSVYKTATYSVFEMPCRTSRTARILH